MPLEPLKFCAAAVACLYGQLGVRRKKLAARQQPLGEITALLGKTWDYRGRRAIGAFGSVVDILRADNHTALFTELQNSDRWRHYLSNAWIVIRRETLVELQGKQPPLIRQQDRMLIMPARGPTGGWLQKDAWDWLNATLPRLW